MICPYYNLLFLINNLTLYILFFFNLLISVFLTKGNENVRAEVYRQGQGLQPGAGHQGPHNLGWFEVFAGHR